MTTHTMRTRLFLQQDQTYILSLKNDRYADFSTVWPVTKFHQHFDFRGIKDIFILDKLIRFQGFQVGTELEQIITGDSENQFGEGRHF